MQCSRLWRRTNIMVGRGVLFPRRKLLEQVIRQAPNGCDVGRGDANSRLGLDMDAQFEVAQRVEAVLGKRLVRVDVATQAQTDLLREQTPQPRGPLVKRQLGEFSAQFV